MDPVCRKKVEDAAQAMLMEHFRNDGWTVQGVRFGKPYDAIATKNGRKLWLEAKGTETNGASVIVTRNEVERARAHAGDCILGILSDVGFLPNGEVDASNGTFRVFTWNPNAADPGANVGQCTSGAHWTPEDLRSPTVNSWRFGPTATFAAVPLAI